MTRPAASSPSNRDRPLQWGEILLVTWLCFAPKLLLAVFFYYWRLIEHVETEAAPPWPLNLTWGYEIFLQLMGFALLYYFALRQGRSNAFRGLHPRQCLEADFWKETFVLGIFAFIASGIVRGFHSILVWPLARLMWGGGDYYPLSPLASASWGLVPLLGVLSIFLLEETVLRVFVQDALFELTGRNGSLAVCLTALLQALIHAGQGFYTACFFWVFSLICGIFYQDSRRILPIVTIHCLTVLFWLASQGV